MDTNGHELIDIIEYFELVDYFDYFDEKTLKQPVFCCGCGAVRY